MKSIFSSAVFDMQTILRPFKLDGLFFDSAAEALPR